MTYHSDQIDYFIFFFNYTATTDIYTLSLHDALPICAWSGRHGRRHAGRVVRAVGAGDPHRRVASAGGPAPAGGDRKSTRLNSSHSQISYAVFCLKKKKNVTV